MKIETVRLSRKFSLGNYEMLECGFEASVKEQDNPLDVLRSLEDLAEMYLTSRTMKTEVKPLNEAEKELLDHEGWKNKKNEDGTYSNGSLSWGWDFKDKFSKEAVAYLSEPRTISGYTFSLGGNNQSLVQVKKVKVKV